MQKNSEGPLTKCPSCSKKALVKLVSAPNFRLKGGGWYETDFKGDKEKKRNLAGADRDESSKSESSTSSATKADSSSKPEGSKSEGAKPETASSDSSSKAASSGGS